MPVSCKYLSIKSKIAFFLLSEVGLSVTTTKEGLFDEALIKPQDPSLKENLTPFTVNTSFISSPSINTLSFLNFIKIELENFQKNFNYIKV